MPTVRQIFRNFHQFFEDHYAYIWLISVLTDIVMGYFHYQLQFNDRDLIYWKNLFLFVYSELEHFALIFFIIIVVAKAVFLAVIIFANSRTFTWFDEISHLEVRKQYAEFLLIRLIVDIEKIEGRYMHSAKNPNVPTINTYILAHEDLQKTIDTFRKDARKLLTPNEIEVSLPIEEVYGLMDHEMRLVRRSRYHYMNLNVDDEVIRALVNPKS